MGMSLIRVIPQRKGAALAGGPSISSGSNG